ncbi:peptidylprolyl isomerase [Maribacter sp. 2307ULW6-5]|uniref:peptidylprolyl isomerase n=1 Tax=Maribacter sp. 2307ULW6-5 TaxID=3386275 RepID=UPI0039BD1433
MMNKVYVLALMALVMTGCKTSQRADLGDGLFADIQTSKGDIVVRLAHDKTPVTVANFVSLAEGDNPFVNDEFKGKPYYDSLTFHRIIKDFMIQGGDPTGTGSGNPGYKFMDEINDSLRHDKKGILAMANSGPATNGSQFYITHAETAWLDGRHTVFGEVVEGIDVVDSLANVPVGEGDKPVDPVYMTTVQIIRNGKEARKFDAVEIMTDYFDGEEERQAAAEKERAEKMAAVNQLKADFVAQLPAQKEAAKALPSGLKMMALQEGEGPDPKLGQKVRVMYAGYLEDGTLFDSNYEEVAKAYNVFDDRRKQGMGYEPVTMDYSPDAGIIAGFKEGLLTMKVGDKMRLFIPSHLGYGAQGGGPIPPNANLIFDVEITGMAE